MRALSIAVLALAAAGGCASQTDSPDVSAQDSVGRCSGADRDARWSKMVTAPIAPLDSVAGIATRAPFALRDVEAALCTGTSLGDDDDGNTFAAWGDAREVTFRYDTLAPHAVTFVQIDRGYRGKLSFASRSGEHRYEIGPGTPILRDGAVFDIAWGSRAAVTELYDALMATFAPAEPADASDCVAAGQCKAEVIGDEAVFTAYPLRLHMHFGAVGGDPSARSTPDYLYMFF